MCRPGCGVSVSPERDCKAPAASRPRSTIIWMTVFAFSPAGVLAASTSSVDAGKSERGYSDRRPFRAFLPYPRLAHRRDVGAHLAHPTAIDLERALTSAWPSGGRGSRSGRRPASCGARTNAGGCMGRGGGDRRLRALASKLPARSRPTRSAARRCGRRAASRSLAAFLGWPRRRGSSCEPFATRVGLEARQLDGGGVEVDVSPLDGDRLGGTSPVSAMNRTSGPTGRTTRRA